MSNIDYNSNADLQIDRYDKAIKNINLAIDKLNEGIEELKGIVGFQGADDLQQSLRDKISYLRGKITDIKNEKTRIYNRSRELQREQDRENEQKEME